MSLYILHKIYESLDKSIRRIEKHPKHGVLSEYNLKDRDKSKRVAIKETIKHLRKNSSSKVVEVRKHTTIDIYENQYVKYIINDITVVMTCSVYILINSFDNFFLSSLTYAICLFPYREIPIIPSIIKYCEYAEVYEYCPWPSGPRTLDIYGTVINGSIIVKIWYIVL